MEDGPRQQTWYSANKQIERFQYSMMSNTRWRAFFIAVAAANLGISRSEWRLVDDERVMLIHGMPQGFDLCETHFADGLLQPFSYKYIRSIFVPCNYKPYLNIGLVRKQDVDELVEALECTGKKFPYEVDEHGFTIYGYK